MLRETHLDLEDANEQHHVNRPSLAEDYIPSRLGCTQESISCSAIIAGHMHSRQTSQASDSSYLSNFAHFLQAQELVNSPGKVDWSEEKENLGGSGRAGHNSTPSVIVNSALEQSYSNILGVLSTSRGSSRKGLSTLRRDSEAGSQDVISDCLSIIESDFRTPANLSLVEPAIVRTAAGRSPTSSGARTSTIYTDLSSDSSRAMSSILSGTVFATPLGKRDPANAFTSPYGATTADSNLLEIDLYESHAAKKPSGAVEASNILGALPAKAYCPTCATNVSTRVSFEIPSEPL